MNKLSLHPIGILLTVLICRKTKGIKYHFKPHLMRFGNAEFDSPIRIQCKYKIRKYEIRSFVYTNGGWNMKTRYS